LLCGFLRLNARNRGSDGGFARVVIGGLRLLFLLCRFTALARAMAASTAALRGSTALQVLPRGLLFCFTRFGAGDGGFDGGFARVDRLLLGNCSGLLFGFTRFGPGDSGFNGGFARVDRCFWGHFNACCSALRALARAMAASTAALRGSAAVSGWAFCAFSA
jgi:hypothetical protein